MVNQHANSKAIFFPKEQSVTEKWIIIKINENKNLFMVKRRIFNLDLDGRGCFLWVLTKVWIWTDMLYIEDCLYTGLYWVSLRTGTISLAWRSQATAWGRVPFQEGEEEEEEKEFFIFKSLIINKTQVLGFRF